MKLNEEYGNFDDSFEKEITNFTFFWNILNQNQWKPCVREGATLNSYEGKIYLYGGKSNELHSDLCELDVECKYKITLINFIKGKFNILLKKKRKLIGVGKRKRLQVICQVVEE